MIEFIFASSISSPLGGPLGGIDDEGGRAGGAVTKERGEKENGVELGLFTL